MALDHQICFFCCVPDDLGIIPAFPLPPLSSSGGSVVVTDIANLISQLTIVAIPWLRHVMPNAAAKISWAGDGDESLQGEAAGPSV
jgi:hypothetical protein